MWLVYWPITALSSEQFIAWHVKKQHTDLLSLKKKQQQKTIKWICDDHKIYFFKIPQPLPVIANVNIVGKM